MSVSASPAPSSVAPDEIARFSALASQWWDPRGPMRPLHAMNGPRIAWTERHLTPLTEARGGRLRVLDLGCGAGLASEALAAHGHDVTGIDASADAIAAARAHLAISPLGPDAGSLRYECGSAEDLLARGERFDAVTAFEVIEHVTDPAAFMAMIAQLLLPGGRAIVSTMNRTVRALAIAKFGAEYVLRLLPRGTHDWRKFVTPAELATYARQAGMRAIDVRGLTWRPPAWRESRDLGINYIAAMTRD
ncbi:3-demethylubiquinone-9 3-methyltransferase [Ameyamaea chiangmaiensis NBRC 103196]|uniref:Ubiquinone biosynthesis O-methyltransferase n=1 Tax=Ameyamaea chiangmaiensis TaxID=442969 RepID=A0A850PCH8_9PROT|nr:bifunctional 2-polyprenyl-6-hydroxyphenol methylase/3-demethylubiquinol 3-O-methyltransferase UbiG [Ameyamaea chiangmaiensis]MBS4073738.1 bifunctional 2-polyprenyl-6-hydroxyphenol methylase/3-demethylubiquinol 3-O-methyltransferase UbiG [Ameyamaea chiangmaiensis]NVN39996.1 bifunctional 2-polyprenyl-6-hydroxyphenol methylase/3-demethylubiquinol 3-O-methyltransferase UbiG [Ameyamaea chiangmaiensis]GBQ68629.1 3-demethylubiquinone-9 3-methyltransferase [Ameyamaea chiangmaiensis NBRC 103196]